MITNQNILLIVGAIIILYIFYNSSIEGFASCQNKRVRLNDVQGGVTTGYAYLEITGGKLGITVEANLPYQYGGVFHSLNGQYNVYLARDNPLETAYVGTMIRERDHMHRLTQKFDGDYSKFTNILITRITEGVPEQTILNGRIDEYNNTKHLHQDVLADYPSGTNCKATQSNVYTTFPGHFV